ncbi:hypothetical protein VKT23_006387 [Stygiomarasmius scandens]|uniref:Uncharacterized protein n=1 Tax=Marasmiellus scandens TaxID=2682957 RepID=A0ABR1JQ57_9AGAR
MSSKTPSPQSYNPHPYSYVPQLQSQIVGVSAISSSAVSTLDPVGKYLGHSARNLLDIALTAVELNFFLAPHGQKTIRRNELQAKVNAAGIHGSSTVLEARLYDLLAWHQKEDCPTTMKEVLDNSPFSASFDGPLNRLAEMLGDSRKERKEHLQKKHSHGGDIIPKESFNTTARTSAGDDYVIPRPSPSLSTPAEPESQSPIGGPSSSYANCIGRDPSAADDPEHPTVPVLPTTVSHMQEENHIPFPVSFSTLSKSAYISSLSNPGPSSKVSGKRKADEPSPGVHPRSKKSRSSREVESHPGQNICSACPSESCKRREERLLLMKAHQTFLDLLMSNM